MVKRKNPVGGNQQGETKDVQEQITTSRADYSTGERKIQMSELPMETTGFVIDSDGKAGWAVKKIAEKRAERDEMIAWYKAQIKKAEEEADNETAYLEKLLRDYFATVPHKTTKTQDSYTFPGGKLILKTQNPDYKRDDATVIDWLEKNKMTDFVKVKKELDWAGLKDVTDIFDGNIVTEDGEIVPGITVEFREPKFIVEVK